MALPVYSVEADPLVAFAKSGYRFVEVEVSLLKAAPPTEAQAVPLYPSNSVVVVLNRNIPLAAVGRSAVVPLLIVNAPVDAKVELPPTYSALTTPSPPSVWIEPVVVLVASVVSSALTTPEAVRVVNAPVLGVTFPTLELLIETPEIVPPVMAAAVVMPSFMLVKFASNSALVSGEPFPALVVIDAMTYPNQVADRVIVQVICIVSSAALFTTAKTVRHNMSPEDDALKIPASVTAPVPTPAPKVATYTTFSLFVGCIDFLH